MCSLFLTTVLVLSLLEASVHSFVPIVTRTGSKVSLSSSSTSPDVSSTSPDVEAAADYNGVFVAKQGGQGVATASQQALQQDLTLGAPPVRPVGGHYLTKGGIQVTAHVEPILFSPELESAAGSLTSAGAIEALVQKLDSHRGVLLASSYEFPGRYARWSLGFVDPPLEIAGRGLDCTITALNDRGRVLMPAVEQALKVLKEEGVLQGYESIAATEKGTGDSFEGVPARFEAKVVPPAAVGTFSEEDRSRQPSLFSVVRALIDVFGFNGGDRQLGLYGAFGYDLTFQFEPIDLKQDRDPTQRDLLLYLPDNIIVVDQDKRDSWKVSYDFCVDQKSTQGMPRIGDDEAFQPFDEGTATFEPRDTQKGTFAEKVELAKREFAVGNLFEAVLSQTFREKLDAATPPSVLFRRLRARNPAPYGFFINLGEQEYLVGASPEMFVRCEATLENDHRPGAIRVETCPISGTVARGIDALEDAQRVKSLMMNAKEESELTMCTDVDRNDKSRICEPGSVQVIGRRQIEMYSRLIHTVDHVVGYLRSGFDALDAFLCHTWAVTVTGAPKTWAIQFVEDTENSPRCWYGGAVGMVGFDGGLNTGLTLRTVRVNKGVAEVRAGATLLYDSNPPAEELETELKASAMIDAIVQSGADELVQSSTTPKRKSRRMIGEGASVVLIDHEDSFVHTLGNYLRQTGASVKTLRSGQGALVAIEKMIQKGEKPNLVVLSPGPGNPSDFKLSDSISFLLKNRIPAFGVCLGLQGMVEHFGGTLGVLGYPMHGKSSKVTLTSEGKAQNSIFSGLPDTFEVARYHSLYGIKEHMPSCLGITALSEDGIVMGIRHKELPFAAVQFHPESILTSPVHGMTILENALTCLSFSDASSYDTGAQIVGDLESLTTDELKRRLHTCTMKVQDSRSENIVRLALWKHKSSEYKAGRLKLDQLNGEQLIDLKQSLGLIADESSPSAVLDTLQASFEQEWK